MSDFIAAKAKPFVAGKLAGAAAAEESDRHEAAAPPAAAPPILASGPGLIELADVGGTIRGFTMFGRSGLGNFDQAGFSVANAGDVDGDGFDDILVGTGGAYLGGGGAYNAAGLVYLINGKASGFADIELDDLDAGGPADGGTYIYGGAQYGGVGYSVSGLGDINGDGFDDFALGAPLAQTPFTTYTNDGRVYIVFGDGAGLPDIDASTLAAPDGFTIDGVYGSGYELGWTATGGGDLNGDGFDDMVISSTIIDEGETFVIFGGSAPFADLDLDDGTPNPTWTFTGAPVDTGSLLRGPAMSATGGDINGDGFDDLILGYHTASEASRTNNGRVEIWLGGNSLPTIGGEAIGAANEDAAGSSVANLGDVNGDGFDDIGVSAASLTSGDPGAAYVLFGKPGGIGSLDLASLTDGFAMTSGGTSDHLASAIASAGDVNGDGYDDVILSAAGAAGGGVAFVVFGKAGATNSFADIDLSTITAADGFKITPEGTTDLLGSSVSSAGDLDGDGFDDLVIGAQAAYDSTDTFPTAGRTYVIFGSDTIGGATSAVTHQGTAANNVIPGSAGADVMIGGRGDDVLMGVGGQDVLRGGEGDDVLQIGDNTFRRIDGGTGTNVMRVTGNFSGGTTLADADFLRVNDVSSIDLFDGSFNVTVGAIASNALIGRTLEIGTTGGNMTGIVNGSQLDEGMNANFLAALGSVTLLGGSAGDSLVGGDAADILRGGGGADTLDGGGGARDRAVYNTSPSGVTVDLMGIIAATGHAVGDDLDNTEDLQGSFFADNLYGRDAEANLLYGLTGNDVLDGRTGNDTLHGGLGDDTLEGGNGTDTASYATAFNGVDVNLSTPGGQDTFGDGTDDLRSIENLVGSAQSDTLSGSNAANDIAGADGSDLISGGDGLDSLRGGAHDDTLIGGAQNDLLVGGQGSDTANYLGLAVALDFDLKTGTATAGAETDTLIQVENAVGGSGNDRFSGNGGDNQFEGRSGLDTILGRQGADTLDGGGNGDRLIGGDGNDEYWFTAGEANGDVVVGFDGNGAAAGDEILFFGYGPSLTFVDLGGGQWQVSDGSITEVIIFIALAEPIVGDDWAAGV